MYFSGPGCPGTEKYAKRLPLDLTQLNERDLLGQALTERIDLVVPGSETLLQKGVADMLNGHVPVFGPTKAAARIETSKKFADDIMVALDVPRARCHWFTDFEPACRAVDTHFAVVSQPLVIKPDEPTGGKGVKITRSAEEAKAYLKELMLNGLYSGAGKLVGLADYLPGPECSVFVICDGDEKAVQCLAAARDCKAAWPAKDGQPAGPNTGGVWSVSSILEWNSQLEADVMSRAVRPVLRYLEEYGAPFVGMLYVALKLTPDGWKVIEYNARAGDPEWQAVQRRMESDPFELMFDAATRSLVPEEIRFSPQTAACLVLAAPGYGTSPKLFRRIRGISLVERRLPEVQVLEAGTSKDKSGRLVTAQGRVLNLVTMADDLPTIHRRFEEALKIVSFDGGMQVRMDVGDPSAAS
jgi:phosphoribosylamine--glycine ligase